MTPPSPEAKSCASALVAALGDLRPEPDPAIVVEASMILAAFALSMLSKRPGRLDLAALTAMRLIELVEADPTP